MNIDFDISTLNPDKLTGVGVYMQQLLNHAALDSEFNLHPVVKASRYKNTAKLLRNIPQENCEIYFPWSFLFRKNSIFHGPDFKLPKSSGKRIVTIHDFVVFEKKYNEASFFEKGIKQLTTVIESAPDAIIVNSEFTKSELLKYFPNVKSTLHRTPLGCDRLPVAEQNTLDLPERYLLYLGTLEKRKNILGALQAFTIYRKQGGQASFVLSGTWGFGSQEIQSELEQHPYRKYIHHLSYVPFPQLGELYKRAEIFFFPSFYEGFGIPILEAMSMGTPVVTSNLGAMQEVAGEAAKTSDPNNSEAMAKALLELSKSKEQQKELTAQGLQRAQLFTWENCWQQTKKVYLSLNK